MRALAGRGVRFVVPRGLGALVRAAGAEAVELGWWESAAIAGVRAHCVPAQHFSGRGLFDRNRRLWAGFVVEGASRRFYRAGDTGYFPGFAEMTSPPLPGRGRPARPGRGPCLEGRRDTPLLTPA